MNRRHFIRRMTLTAAGLWVPNVLAQRTRRLGGGQPWSAGAAAFNGSSWLYRGTLNGVAQSNSGTISVWFRSSSNGANQYILSISRGTTSNVVVLIQKEAYNRASVILKTVTGTTLLSFYGGINSLQGTGWYHLYLSCDTTGGGFFSLCVNGVASSSPAITEGDIAWSAPFCGVAAMHGGANPLTGSIAELAVYPGSGFRDWATYGSKFYSSGRPVDLGPTGASPWGQTPLIYLHGSGANFGRNYGTGGDYTVGGTLTADSSTVAKT